MDVQFVRSFGRRFVLATPSEGRHLAGDRSSDLKLLALDGLDGSCARWDRHLRMIDREAMSMRRAFGGCLGTRRR